MSWLRRFAVLILAAMLGCAALAQGSGKATVVPTVSALREALDRLPETVENSEDIAGLVLQLNAVGTDAEKFIAARTGELNDLNARLGELGNPPPAGAPPENADITSRRALLTKERNALDADIRLARLVSVDAQQRVNDLMAKRRAMFEAQLTERAPSPLGREF